jgi:hypothetical protein
MLLEAEVDAVDVVIAVLGIVELEVVVLVVVVGVVPFVEVEVVVVRPVKNTSTRPSSC